MENPTFRSRLSQLMQKSRKALRLYSSMSVGNGAINSARVGSESGEFSDLQVMEWREVNSELLKALTVAVGSPTSKRVVADVFALRDRFHAEWRAQETEQHQGQSALVLAAQQGDFVRAAVVSRSLVICKARMQACHAAYQELHDVLTQSRIPTPAIELSHVHTNESRSNAYTELSLAVANNGSAGTNGPVLAKVIPIRKRVAER